METAKRKLLVDFVIDRMYKETLKVKVEEQLNANNGEFQKLVDIVNGASVHIDEGQKDIKTERHGFERLITLGWTEGTGDKGHKFNRGLSILFIEANSTVEIYFGGDRRDEDVYNSMVTIEGKPDRKGNFLIDSKKVTEVIKKALKPITHTANTYDCTLIGSITPEQILNNKPISKRKPN